MDGSPQGLAGVDPAVVLDNLPELVFLADADGTIQWASHNVVNTLGWSPDDLLGRAMYDLFAKSVNHQLHLEALVKVVATPGLHGPVEVTVVDGEGRQVELELLILNLLDDPAVGLIVATGRDITGLDLLVENLRQREAWASSLLSGGTDLVIVCDGAGVIGYVGPSVTHLLDLDPGPLIGRSVAELVHPDDLLGDPDLPVDRQLGTGPGRRPLLRFNHADGSWRRMRIERSATHLTSDRAVLLTGRLLTEVADAADLLSEQSVLLERIARGAPVADTLRGIEHLATHRMDDGHFVIGFLDPGGEYLCEAPDVDPDLVGILDQTGIIRPPGSSAPIVTPPTYRQNEGWNSVLRAASDGRYAIAWVADLAGASDIALGRVVFLRTNPAPLTAPETELLGLVADLATIAVERHGLQSRLSYGALHDELTGLPNRRLLLRRLRDTFVSPESYGGLLFVDIDRFKLINDSLGHDAGDQLLREVTARFKRALRPHDLLARVGGDEFVVLCPQLDDVESVAKVAARLTRSLADLIDLPGGRVMATVSSGVVHVVGEVEPTEILRDADLAMYEAKRLGRNRIEVFHQDLRERAVARLDVENALRDAIRDDEMQLHYQPVIRLTDGRMVGVEALLRWERPGLGLVQPGAFVPVATDTGLMLPLGRWVIEQAVQAAARWPELEVAANLSARQLDDVDLVDFVAHVLAQYRVTPGRLCLEVTEADLISDTALVADQLARIKELGVRLAIDDFGTGFATLDYLRRFATADILKVDASFAAGVTDPASHDLAIVSAAMVLADALGFETVAEGIETEGQREVFARLGCEKAQGFLFSPPVGAADIDEMLRIRRVTEDPAAN